MARILELPPAVLCVTLCCAGTLALAQEEDPAAATRTLYTQRVAEIEKKHARSVRALGDDFLIALEAAEVKLQKSGDLDGVLAVRGEVARFTQERNVPRDDDGKLPPAVKQLRTIFLEAGDKAASKRDLKKAALARTYVAYLDGLTKKLTVEGKVEQALAVREEARQLGKLADQAPAPGRKPAGASPSALKGLVVGWQGQGSSRFQHSGGNKSAMGRLHLAGGRTEVGGLDAKWTEPIQASNELSLVVHFKTDKLNQTGPARILTCSRDGLQRNFSICQEAGNLILRLRTTKTGNNGNNPQVTLGPIQADTLHRLAVTYRKGQLKCYLDGKVREVGGVVGDFSNWDSFPLVLGNEAKDERPWQGEVHAFAVYSSVLPAQQALDQTR